MRAGSCRADLELYIVISSDGTASVHHRQWNRGEMHENMNVVRILALKKPECRLIIWIHYGRLLNWVDHHSETQKKLCVVK